MWEETWAKWDTNIWYNAQRTNPTPLIAFGLILFAIFQNKAMSELFPSYSLSWQ